jgi:hypothetical protein
MGGYLEIARRVKEKRDSSSHLTPSRPLYLQRSPCGRVNEGEVAIFRPALTILHERRYGWLEVVPILAAHDESWPSAKKPWREGRGRTQGGDER